MWLSDRINNDESYREAILKDLESGVDDPEARPVVVQLAGNTVESFCAAASVVQPYCDAVGTYVGRINSTWLVHTQ